MPGTMTQPESGLKILQEVLSLAIPATLRLVHSSRSTGLALAIASVLLAAQVAPSRAASGSDLPTMAEAYGEYWLFVLNVAAGNDGQSVAPAGEREIVNEFATDVLNAYQAMSVEQRQALAEYPARRDLVQQVWPTLSPSQR